MQGSGRVEIQHVEMIEPVGGVLEGSKDADAGLDKRRSVRDSASRQGRGCRAAGHADFSLMRVGSYANPRGIFVDCSV